MERQLYNLYQGETLILKDGTPEQAWKILKKRYKLAYYADKGVLLAGKYKVERSKLEQDYDELKVKRRLLQNWEQLVEPFRRVIWVTEIGKDTRVLGRRG